MQIIAAMAEGGITMGTSWDWLGNVAGSDLRAHGMMEVALRLFAAMACGAAIGFERERAARPAGLRTHILVALAAALFTVLTGEIMVMPGDDDRVTADPLRVIEAVTSGVAFLAAGSIVFSRGAVRGITTGAGMWLAGAIGLACGMGLLQIAALATALALVVLALLARLAPVIAPQEKAPQEQAPQEKAPKDGD
ncbi:MgtC/SapB family protein [Paralimibaculum aggregatum]|uniref:Protein MgtC n=1 Tax=Paralimibaculum aggregatum TaxID=3036245 RepID=A0ABQ6LKI1_9RHOB|nr:MgtC/SapB family protein [Limibaculum sp. NKW23]GMG80916.1 MgtC/SapB family protein [Limibaculum sp. NKW23]